MSSYLARLKQLESEKNLLYSSNTEPAKPPKAPFDGFGGTPQGVNVKKYFNNEKVKVAKVARVANPKTDQIAESHKDEKLLALDMLVQYIAERENFSEEATAEAKFLASKDVELALTSFRALAQTIRRDRAMELLQASPESPRAVYIDSDSDPKNIILAIAVRHVAVAEMTVPRVKYDPWKMINILNTGVH